MYPDVIEIRHSCGESVLTTKRCNLTGSSAGGHEDSTYVFNGRVHCIKGIFDCMQRADVNIQEQRLYTF